MEQPDLAPCRYNVTFCNFNLVLAPRPSRKDGRTALWLADVQ